MLDAERSKSIYENLILICAQVAREDACFIRSVAFVILYLSAHRETRTGMKMMRQTSNTLHVSVIRFLFFVCVCVVCVCVCVGASLI